MILSAVRDVSQWSALGAVIAFASYLSKKLLKLDGTSIRIIDDACAKELAVCRAQIADLRVEVAILQGQVRGIAKRSP